MEKEHGGKRFAVVAVEKGFATEEQVLEALKIQLMEDLARKGHRLIGEILVSQGYITEERVDEVVLEIMAHESWGEKKTPGPNQSRPRG